MKVGDLVLFGDDPTIGVIVEARCLEIAVAYSMEKSVCASRTHWR